MWVLVGCAMVVISGTLPLHLLNRVAGFVGIAYAPDLLLLVAVVFLVVLVFYLSITVARLREEHRILVEEFAVAMARSLRKGVGAGEDMRSGADTAGEVSGLHGSPDLGNGEEQLPGSTK
jgi:hypothetical protein